jgi:hypothetical protein
VFGTQHLFTTSEKKIISESYVENLISSAECTASYHYSVVHESGPIGSSVDNRTAGVPARRGSTLDTAGAYARARAPAGPHARRTSLAAPAGPGGGGDRARAVAPRHASTAHSISRTAGRPTGRRCRAPRVPAGALRPGPPCHRAPLSTRGSAGPGRAQRRRRDAAGVATRAAHYWRPIDVAGARTTVLCVRACVDDAYALRLSHWSLGRIPGTWLVSCCVSGPPADRPLGRSV